MKELIAKLREEMSHHREEAEKRRKVIEVLQEVCPHDECEPDGHDSHYSCERCKVCGYERRV